MNKVLGGWDTYGGRYNDLYLPSGERPAPSDSGRSCFCLYCTGRFNSCFAPGRTAQWEYRSLPAKKPLSTTTPSWSRVSSVLRSQPRSANGVYASLSGASTMPPAFPAAQVPSASPPLPVQWSVSSQDPLPYWRKTTK